MASVTYAPNRLHSLDLDAVTSMEPFIAQDPVKLVNTLTAKFIVDLIANTLTGESIAQLRAAAVITSTVKSTVLLSVKHASTSMEESTAVSIAITSTAAFIARPEAWLPQQRLLGRRHRPVVAEL
jgi:hypothetical protein